MGEIVMPRLSDTMEEGTILRWLKADGEHVQRGEDLVEIETDKATMNYQSDQEGVLRTVVQEGDTLPVGARIAWVGAEDAAPRDASAESAAAEEGEQAPARAAESPAPAAQEEREPAAGASEGRVKASPIARRLARARGVDLGSVTGTGPAGRIVRADVESAAAGEAQPPAGSAVATEGEAAPEAPRAELQEPAVSTAKGETTTVELTRTQQTIARRMAESRATIPDFSLQVDVDMEACVALREELKSAAVQGSGTPTYNDMVVKACALALREQPRVNSSYRDGRVQLHARVNVGVAVAAEGTLIVPTVFDADTKALGEIARETRALVERVRSGEITPPELGGGTFTVSNLGMLGASSFTAIINPPQAAILTVGTLERRAIVAQDGAVVARATLTLTLICDHRVLYGADAARFGARVRELLEAPAALTL
jgi:pyruvate dehydrogenase E2 component (dihydrolipoamide acetyltransferase)